MSTPEFCLVESSIMEFLQKHRKLILLLLGNLIALIIVSNELNAQDQPYIFGTVTTYTGQYTGQMQWGDEEAIWFDLFNAEKVEKPKEVSVKNEWSLAKIWTEGGTTIHQFNCQFGNIKEIVGIGKSRFTLIQKDGTSIVLNGDGYNDAGSDIRINDLELGMLEISWDKIRKIEFKEAPRNLEPMAGTHLYGTVQTDRKGNFKGYLIWDNDERLDEEKLDGDEKGRDLSIPFKNISSIRKEGRGCDVTLHSGRTLYLTNSNDVNEGNRGIMVMNPEIGFIEIPWRYFSQVNFSEPQTDLGYSYFKRPKGISGQVYTKNESHTGQLIYDLDEYWEYEMIEGMDDGIQYKIPIHNIRRIEPKNSEYSEIQLKNGTTLLLGKLRDVTSGNAGILVIDKSSKTKHVRWDQVQEIVLD